MIKNKIDYKLINVALLVLIIFLMYQTGSLWMGVLSKIWQVMEPLFLSFILAYALYPLVQYLNKRNCPKTLSIVLTLFIVFGILSVMIILVAPVLVKELSNLFSSIMVFVKEISVDFDVNLGPLQMSLNNVFDNIVSATGKYLSDGAISIINVSLSFFTTLLIVFSLTIYLLVDMDKIRKGIIKYVKRKNKKAAKYLALLDTEMRNYLSGFLRIAIISFFEYGIVYFIIGHPNALLLAVLAMVANLIPYFGGMINNTVAAITAFVISPNLFFKTLVAFAVLSGLDGYVINPLVYGKTNKVHPIVVIFSVFAGGILMGALGIVIALPLAIIIITTIQFYKDDIYEKIEDIKEKNETEAKEV